MSTTCDIEAIIQKPYLR